MHSPARRLLWVVSTLAVTWTLVNVVMLFAMPGTCPMCTTMAAQHGGGAMAMPDGTAGGVPRMGWMMLSNALAWIVMVILDAVFVYLAATALSRRAPST